MAKRGPKPYHGRTSTQDDYATQYVQEYSRCGKPNCRKCAEGPGHGPYWYAYQLDAGTRRKTKKYIGKERPTAATEQVEHQ